MLDRFVEYNRILTAPSIAVPFSEYCAVLASYFKKTKHSPRCFKEYERVFMSLMDWKKDFFFTRECSIFLASLLFGLRIQEAMSLLLKEFKSKVSINVLSEKGSRIRIFDVSKKFTLIKTLIRLRDSVSYTMNYRAYYRALYRANPNFYTSFNSGHLSATHVPRHLFVQVCLYVLKIPALDVSRFMGWWSENTITNYSDRKMFERYWM